MSKSILTRLAGKRKRAGNHRPSRVGQGRFREDAMGLWGGRCAVTGLDIPPLQDASHIKPWRDSDYRERLDPYNGLLPSPAYDAAYDAGLITLAQGGQLIISARLTRSQIERLDLDPSVQVRRALPSSGRARRPSANRIFLAWRHPSRV
jgi:hypothetical protein